MTDPSALPPAQPDPTTPPPEPFAQYAPPPLPSRTTMSTRAKVLIAVGIVFVVALVVVAVVAALVTYRAVHAPGGSQSQSYTFTSQDYGYTVAFPGKPQEASQVVNVQGNDVTVVTESWSSGDRAAVVSAADYPDGFITDVDAALKGSIEGYAGNIPGATLTDETPRTFAGLKAIEGTITVSAGTLDVIIAFDGDRQFQLTDGNGTPAEKKAFFDSFTQAK